MVKTEIDIAFIIFIVSRFVKNVGSDHFTSVDHIWKYSARGLERGITYGGKSKLNHVTYLDFDKIRDYFDKKSRSGIIYEILSSYSSKNYIVFMIIRSLVSYF